MKHIVFVKTILMREQALRQETSEFCRDKSKSCLLKAPWHRNKIWLTLRFAELQTGSIKMENPALKPITREASTNTTHLFEHAGSAGLIEAEWLRAFAL